MCPALGPALGAALGPALSQWRQQLGIAEELRLSPFHGR